MLQQDFLDLGGSDVLATPDDRVVGPTLDEQIPVGVDGANNSTVNSGQMLINLKAGHGSQAKVMQRLRERAAQVAGMELYLQPTQDLTVDAESGPTQYRVSVEGQRGERRAGKRPRPFRQSVAFTADAGNRVNIDQHAPIAAADEERSVRHVRRLGGASRDASIVGTTIVRDPFERTVAAVRGQT
jgi:hypothetical protein